MLQTGFITLVMLVLIYLLGDGLVTKSVWIKGSRSGIANFRHWAHKRSLQDEPFSYWAAMIFYSLALLAIAWLLVSP